MKQSAVGRKGYLTVRICLLDIWPNVFNMMWIRSVVFPT
jgi:hypothetical protein